jgi:hypothetical protein
VNPHAEGGDHDPENLVTLCGVHHHAAHHGRILVTGTYSSGLVFRHADGKPYGAAASPEACDLRQKVFLGLRGLGFHETEVRHALEAVHTTDVGATMTPATMLRKALAVLNARLDR